VAPAYIDIDDFAAFGVRAVITTRVSGDFALNGGAPIGEVLHRWEALRAATGVGATGSRFATGKQVHGTRVLEHGSGWAGWLRADEGDGHFANEPGIGLGVTVADCVPAFLAHPSGAISLVHAGWRGTAAGILRVALAVFEGHGLSLKEVRVHLGPSICGNCYEVGADVYARLTGAQPSASRKVDLRALLAAQVEAAGVVHVTTSRFCTRCDNRIFFSHRAGDTGRQAAVIARPCRSITPMP
jgi:YfiH family protein